jgi:hypothetical protein
MDLWKGITYITEIYKRENSYCYSSVASTTVPIEQQS